MVTPSTSAVSYRTVLGATVCESWVFINSPSCLSGLTNVAFQNASRLEAQITQPCVIIGTPPEWPVIFAIRFQNRTIIDGRMPNCHEPVVIEFPVLIAVRAIPVTRIIVPFISEAYRDAVSRKGPEFLDESIVQFLCPLAREKGDDFVSTADELRPIPPPRVDRVGQSNFFRITSIPAVFGDAHLLNRTLARERRQRWASCDGCSCHNFISFKAA